MKKYKPKLQEAKPFQRDLENVLHTMLKMGWNGFSIADAMVTTLKDVAKKYGFERIEIDAIMDNFKDYVKKWV